MSARFLIIGIASLMGLFAVPWGISAAGSDLVVAMQGLGTANRGQTVQYTVMVANNGPDAAEQARMTSSTPYDFLFEPNFSDSRCNAPYGSVSCDLGFLPAGTVTNLTLAFTVRPLTTLSYCSTLTVDVTASLSFGGSDPLFGNNSATVRTLVPCPPPTECNDGIDNDRDGALDYSAYSWGNSDFGCLSANDRDERYPKAVCQDGRDNDGDGLSDFPWDPGCSSRQDNDEFNLPSSSPPVSPPPPWYSPPLSSSPSSSPPLFPTPTNPPPLPASLLPQGRTPWLALPIPRCYNNVGQGYAEDIMIDLRCNGSKWGSEGRTGLGGSGRGGSSGGGSGGGGMGGGNGNGGGSGGGGLGSFGGWDEMCIGKEQAVVERTSNQQEVFPGSVVRYTIIVRHTSLRCLLSNLVLWNRLSSGTVVLDAGGGVFDGNGIRWNIPRIDPGTLHRISYNVRVPLSFSHGNRFGGELSLDGVGGLVSIRDDGFLRVLHRFPKTGVDLSLMRATFWILLATMSLCGGRRLFHYIFLYSVGDFL
ncbi:hypothetical protein A3H22_04450 [Candidatus Peribacteria bacterium RIFCSPLOWO2_12_FULL_55_15]|nr:MAG: hypothetical protein A3H22_04450 [Candidatus Peribacteria bacterium RIFCSPLOWO2_12_FULL_55_15]